MKSHPPNFFILPFLQIILSFHYSILLLFCFRWLSVFFPGFDHFVPIPDFGSLLYSASPSIRDVSYPDLVSRGSSSSVLPVLLILDPSASSFLAITLLDKGKHHVIITYLRQRWRSYYGNMSRGSLSWTLRPIAHVLTNR